MARRMALGLGGFFDKEFRDTVNKAYGEGREDHTKAAFKARELAGEDTDAPRIVQTLSTNPTFTRAREMTGTADPNYVEARRSLGMGAAQTPKQKVAQAIGTLGADVTQDNSRNLYWLLNAAQATGNVIAEYGMKMANPKLYGAKDVKTKSGLPIRVTKNPLENQDALNAGIIDRETGDLKAGFGIREQKDELPNGTIKKTKYYTQRNFEPGHVAALGIPTGIAINTGLGLMTPFGGAEGYQAALPSEEDPTKTANVIGEIGQKYLLGTTGKMLPYSEFSKVRPDVSPEEYRAYQAFKYDKGMDLNPFDDGKFGLPGGVIKTTDEGVHGPELQFLGRSLPVTTGIVPYLGALAGGVAGVRTKMPIRGGFGGGMAGLAVGQIAGNLLEEERRRRNTVENQLDNPQF